MPPRPMLGQETQHQKAASPTNPLIENKWQAKGNEKKVQRQGRNRRGQGKAKAAVSSNQGVVSKPLHAIRAVGQLKKIDDSLARRLLGINKPGAAMILRSQEDEAGVLQLLQHPREISERINAVTTTPNTTAELESWLNELQHSDEDLRFTIDCTQGLSTGEDDGSARGGPSRERTHTTSEGTVRFDTTQSKARALLEEGDQTKRGRIQDPQLAEDQTDLSCLREQAGPSEATHDTRMAVRDLWACETVRKRDLSESENSAVESEESTRVLVSCTKG